MTSLHRLFGSLQMLSEVARFSEVPMVDVVIDSVSLGRTNAWGFLRHGRSKTRDLRARLSTDGSIKLKQEK